MQAKALPTEGLFDCMKESGRKIWSRGVRSKLVRPPSKWRFFEDEEIEADVDEVEMVMENDMITTHELA